MCGCLRLHLRHVVSGGVGVEVRADRGEKVSKVRIHSTEWTGYRKPWARAPYFLEPMTSARLTASLPCPVLFLRHVDHVQGVTEETRSLLTGGKATVETSC